MPSPNHSNVGLQGGLFIDSDVYLKALRSEKVNTTIESLTRLERGYRMLAHSEEKSNVFRSIGSRVIATDLWEFVRKESVDEAHKQALRTASEKATRMLVEKYGDVKMLGDISNDRDPLVRLGALFVLYGFSLDKSAKQQFRIAIDASLRETTSEAFDLERRPAIAEEDRTFVGSAAAAASSSSSFSSSSSSSTMPTRPRSAFTMINLIRELEIVHEANEHEDVLSIVSTTPIVISEAKTSKADDQGDLQRAMRQAEEERKLMEHNLYLMERNQYLLPLDAKLVAYSKTILQLRETLKRSLESSDNAILETLQNMQTETSNDQKAKFAHEAKHLIMQYFNAAETVIKTENSAFKKEQEFKVLFETTFAKVKHPETKRGIQKLLNWIDNILDYTQNSNSELEENLKMRMKIYKGLEEKFPETV